MDYTIAASSGPDLGEVFSPCSASAAAVSGNKTV